MINDLFFLVVGAFIGWLIPEPNWAKHFLVYLGTKFPKIFGWLVPKAS